MNAFTRYSLYLLGVVLSLLLGFLILKTVFLSPVKASATTPTLKSTTTIKEELPLTATPVILPETAVYYHGVRLGEFISEDATVADAMAHFNVTLGENDQPNYSPDEQVFHGMTLCIDEVKYVETIIDNAIPYEIIEVQSQTTPKGERVIDMKGVMGSNRKTITTKYVNGEATDEQKIEESYIAPINEVILVGVGGVFTAPDGKDYNYSYYIDVTATAYTHTGNRTYTGTVAEVGVIAVDPRNIALRSNVYVIGNYGDYGVCRAEDIGGGIKGKRIDVFLDTEEECVQFGRRKMRCYVLE